MQGFKFLRQMFTYEYDHNLTPSVSSAVMAERLRRLTRNQIPSGSVGSNPTDCEYFLACNILLWTLFHPFFIWNVFCFELLV